MDTRPAHDAMIRDIDSLIDRYPVESDVLNRLKAALGELEARERELSAIRASARAVLENQSFAEAARAVFDHCCELTGATSGYVALLSDTGEENEVLFLEAGGLPCDVNPELPMPIRGLRAEAYRHNKAVYDNDFMNSQWAAFMPAGHVILKNVMFAPLVLEEKTVGIIGLANKAAPFDDEDARKATGFGELAALALKNSRERDERIAAEEQREQVIDELRKALSEVRELSGLLPICSMCKNIRGDKGYWEKIESYIAERSDARFTHGYCPDCTQKALEEIDAAHDVIRRERKPTR